MNILEMNIETRYDDLDNKNFLSLRSILKLMLEAAAKASDNAGYGKFNISKTNVIWILLNWKVQILKKIPFGIPITVKTWPRETKKVYSYRDFEVLDKNGNKLAIASSKWILVSAKDHSLQKITDDILAKYPITNISVFPDGLEDKLKSPKDSLEVINYTVQRRDIDSFNHVNNLCYLDFAIEALPEDIYLNNDFNHLEIMYKKEAKIGENLKFLYKFENNKHIVTIKSDDLKTLHSIIILS